MGKNSTESHRPGDRERILLGSAGCLTVLGHEVIILTIRWRSSRTIRFEGRAQAFEASYRSP